MPAVAHATDTFSAADTTQIFTQSWLPETTPRARVLLIHGLGEHSSRYEYVATALVGHGFAVHTLDHRGHGHSAGKRVQVRHFSDYTDDVHAYVNAIRRADDGIPFFVLGHSMGGLIALCYVIDHPDGVAGIVVSATAAAPPARISPATIRLGRVVARVAPSVGVASLPLDKVSRDPDVVRAYFADPLITARKIRARLGAELMTAMAKVDAAAPSLTLPVLVLHGGADAITDTESSRHLAERVGSSDVELKVYPELYHEIFNEPERDTVIGDVVHWLDAHIAQS